ncbi:MAG TPA: hypothetical protein VGP24_17945 [Glaciihabitans sp.]|jgi:ammonia channel protein AmtB|nr:hypothetical protein [Glaciihabitans sp.]
MLEVMPSLSAVSVLACIPALSLLHREHLDGHGQRRSVFLTITVCAIGLLAWLVVTAAVPTVISSPLWLPVGALGSLGVFLATVVLRSSAQTSAAVVIYAVGWSALVFAPIALLTLFPERIDSVLNSTVDLGGALAVHVAAGVSAAVSLIVTRRLASQRTPGIRPHSFVLGGAALLLWVSWAISLVGLELAVDEVTSQIIVNCIIAPLAAIVGWGLIEFIRTHTISLPGIIAAGVAGLVVVTAGTGFLTPMWAVVAGLSAGAICASIVFTRIIADGRRGWAVLGVHGGAGILGVVLLGIFGTGFGFIYTGQPDRVISQLIAALLVAAWTALVSLGLSALIGEGSLARARMRAPSV